MDINGIDPFDSSLPEFLANNELMPLPELLNFFQDELPGNDMLNPPSAGDQSAAPKHGTTNQTTPQESGASLDPAELKKQRLRENKRRCLAKKKAQMENTEKELQRAREERDRLLKEREELMYHSQALYKIQEYTSGVLESLKDRMYEAGTLISQWTYDIYVRNVSAVKSHILNNVTLPDAVIRQIVHGQNLESIYNAREGLFSVFRQLVEEYDSTFDDLRRKAIEEQLIRMNLFRDRLMNIAASERPDLLAAYIHGKMLPPGKETDRHPFINPLLYPALHEITLTPKRRSQLAVLVQLYREQVAMARKEVHQVQEQLPRVVDAAWPSDNAEKTLRKAAEGYLYVTDAAAVLRDHAKREAVPTLSLMRSISKILSTIELFKLASCVHPYMIDPLQLAELLLAAPVLTGESGGSGDSDIDACHLIATVSN